jgi:hypothetical protein
MKHIISPTLILLAATLSACFSVQAEQAPTFKPQSGAPASSAGSGTHFNPPQSVGAPARSTGSATRGDLEEKAKQIQQPSVAEQIQLLATKQTKLTALATPTLYWYASNTSPYNVKITVWQGENEPLLEKNIGTIKTAGIQTIRLADYGVTLTAGQTYSWSVAVSTDPKNPSGDLLVNATIRYEKPAKPLTDIEQQTKAGYWYDAVAQLAEAKKLPQLQDLLNKEGIAVTVTK